MTSSSDLPAQAVAAGASREYPAERSFVVQLASDADPAHGLVCGRVEHVGSGRAALFASLAELAGFLAEASPARPRFLTDR